ncbi:AraC family transcriptional regulator [Mycolicibacterium hodleri]|uniref:AraC family transcriptional regulator n=1 Tax=Mycolicibacterium hodleri TaxID=49897 RepID=A0A502EB91_9MYCO|nr:AraC family transcriptional regulator [Mycolicibacterium hodleri]TPG34657.1 AraC family transcriptional regulator [Mycolicibacterium hodleri]
MGNLIRASALQGYGHLVRELGGEPDWFLERYGIPVDSEVHEDGFVPFRAYVHLLEASADELGCPDFGLRMAQWQGLDIFGPLAVIARNARTVLDGLQAIARFLYVHSPALTLRLLPPTAKGTIKFAFELTEPGLPEVIQAYEISMAVAARIVHLLGGPEARPRTVWFMHPQRGPDASYQQAFGCRVRFGRSSCGFELRRALADRRIESADPEASRLAAKYLERNYLPPTAPLSHRVAQLAHQLLPTGQCSVDAIAGELAMHPRSLQRQLAAEGTRCQDVIDSERRAAAEKYLAKPGLELSQVTGLLGYTEQSALNRSCRRWFDKTPRQVRAEAAAR